MNSKVISSLHLNVLGPQRGSCLSAIQINKGASWLIVTSTALLLSVFNCGSIGSTAKPQIHRKIHHLLEAPNAFVFHLSLSLSFSQHHHSYFHTSWCLFVSHFKWGCRWKDSCMSVKTLNQMSVLIDKLVHSNLHSTLAGRKIWWHMWTHSGQLTVCGYSPTVSAEKVVFSFTAASMVTVKNMSLKQEPSRFGLQSNRFAE